MATSWIPLNDEGISSNSMVELCEFSQGKQSMGNTRALHWNAYSKSSFSIARLPVYLLLSYRNVFFSEFIEVFFWESTNLHKF